MEMQDKKWEEVGQMFFGNYFHSLDAKGRMVVPSKFRSEAGALVYIMKGFEGAVEVYKQETFEQEVARLSTLTFTNKIERDYKRTRLASVIEIEIDDHGRMALPSKMLQDYHIGKDVVIVGVQDHFEIWDEKRWIAYNEEQALSLEEMAETLAKETR